MFPLVVGYSFGEYLAVTRIGHAKTLLAETYLHCHAIALQVGYLNERCFSQAFRRRTGLSPTEYRRANARAGHAWVTSYSE
jgi:two-component system response regulator YesN